jgi:hypothetical protein
MRFLPPGASFGSLMSLLIAVAVAMESPDQS